MRNYSFTKTVSNKELQLFEYLVEHPEYKSDFAYDILLNAMDGRIDLNKPFNYLGYEIRIRKNNDLIKHNKAKYETSSDVQVNSEMDTTVKDNLTKEEDMAEELINELGYKQAVEFLKNADWYISEYVQTDTKDINLNVCFKRAMSGEIKAIKTLKTLCSEDSFVRDIIFTVLSHGIDEESRKSLVFT